MNIAKLYNLDRPGPPVLVSTGRQKLTNVYGLPQGVIDALDSDNYGRGDADISVTQLVDPPRLVALYEKHKREIVNDVSDLLFVLQGKAMHMLLERFTRNALKEERLSIEVLGWKISGQLDNFALENDGLWTLSDWKNTSVWSVINWPKAEWVGQVNCYAHLLRAYGYQVDKTQVVAMLRNWETREAAEGGTYPPHPIAVREVELWSPERCQEYIEKRVLLHQAARYVLPLCEEEERWAQPVRYALMKKGNKKATRVFDSPSAAEIDRATRGAGYYVEERPGVYKRCEFDQRGKSYCPVAKWCCQAHPAEVGNVVAVPAAAVR